MKRLVKKATHDWDNRDLAIVYINGEVYEDSIHGICLQRYIEDNNLKLNEDIDLSCRPEVDQFKEISKMNGGQDVILAHKVEKANAIYFIYGLRNGEEMTDEQIIADLKEIYSNYDIINDLDHDNNDNHGYDAEEQIDNGSKRIYEFEMRKIQPLLDSGKFKPLKGYDNIIYNDYCYISYDLDEKEFRIRTILNTGYDAYKWYDLKTLNDTINDVENKLSNMINEIKQCGFTFDYKSLVNNGKMILKKENESQIIKLIGDPDNEQFIFDHDYLYPEIVDALAELGIVKKHFITLEQIKMLEQFF